MRNFSGGSLSLNFDFGCSDAPSASSSTSASLSSAAAFASAMDGNPDHCATRSRLTAKRSEEHTSELQSHVNLVCRLLLEKTNPGLPEAARSLHLRPCHRLAPRRPDHRRAPPRPTVQPAGAGRSARPGG